MTPLYLKKTSDKFGIIINANIKTEENKINIKNFYNRAPTRILMITNMIYPEEINNDVYNEIREETEKYGTVNDIKFFQFHNTEVNIPIEESVRVFIEYERLVE